MTIINSLITDLMNPWKMEHNEFYVSYFTAFAWLTSLNWTHCTYRTYVMWLYLSGLPFQHHGELWLGLVYGMKRWFIYPPGASPPPSTERTYNPLHPVLDWFTSTYPRLKGLSQPPVNGDMPVPQGAGHQGYRPLECVQMPGDIMYVPALWDHCTINIGEASLHYFYCCCYCYCVLIPS